MDGIIERFRESDIDELHSLIVNTIRKCYSGYYPLEAVDHFIGYSSKENILLEGREHFVIVLRAGGKIVGTGTLIGAHVQRVFVEPELQGRGFGRMIMDILEEKARENGFLMVDLHSSLFAKRFYDGIGYRMFRLGKIEVEGNELLYYQRMGKVLYGDPGAPKWNLDGKKFAVVETQDNVDWPEEGTIFGLYQNGNLVYAEHNSAKTGSGEIFGIMEYDFIRLDHCYDTAGVEKCGCRLNIGMHGRDDKKMRLTGEMSPEHGNAGFILEER